MICPNETYEKWYRLGLEGKRVGEFFEYIIEELYSRVLTEGNAIDCGANKGRHTYPMAEVLRDRGTVLAIEAIPDLNKEMNEIIKSKSVKNIITELVAVSNEIGESDFMYVKNSSGYSGLKERADLPADLEKSIENIRVTKNTLDNLAKKENINKIKFIKMDLEGGEFHALLGASRILKEDRPIVVMENGGGESAKLYNYEIKDFFKYLNDINYRAYDLFGREYTEMNYGEFQRPWYLICINNVSDEEYLTQNLIDIIECAELKFYENDEI